MAMSNESDWEIESQFPNISRTGYKLTSPANPRYNCIAWAAGIENVFWWPDQLNQVFWPKGIPRNLTLESFVRAYNTIGYDVCDSPEYIEGIEKIVIYTDVDNKPTHAARQIGINEWTSKLGKYKDISHTLDGLNGEIYGKPIVFMKRDKKV